MKDFSAQFRPPEEDDRPLDLALIAADDALIEALRTGPVFEDPVPALLGDDHHGRHARLSATPLSTGEAVERLLHGWRQEIEATPLPAPIDPDVAVAIVRQAPPRRRSLRPMIAVAASITALLIGSTAIGARSATPDSVLWSVTELLWGDRADSVLAGQSAREGLDAAHEALEAGHPEMAQTALVEVTSVITLVAERDGRQTLESEYESVRSQLEIATQTARSQSPASSTASTSQLPTGLTATTAVPPPVVETPSSSSTPSPEPTPTDTGSPDPSPSDEPTTSDPTTEDPTETSTETPSPTTPTTEESGTDGSLAPPADGADGLGLSSVQAAPQN